MRNTVGPPVQGADFFDRTRELQRVWNRLDTGNVLLLAPRRVGKTSLMYRLQELAPGFGFAAAYLSVADVQSEQQFIGRLYDAAGVLPGGKRALSKIAKSPLGKLVRRITTVAVPGFSIELTADANDKWTQLGDALTRSLSTLKQKSLFLVDELPIFVLHLVRLDPTGQRARIFLNWFRQLRLDPSTASQVRWLLAGSIGLDTVTRRMNLGDTINDLYIESDFGAFKENVADEFLDQLGRTYGLELDGALKAHLRSKIGWLIPYHLQLFFAELREQCGDRDLPPSLELIDQVYEALFSPSKRAYFDYWEQRLREELGSPEDKQALTLLNNIAADPQGATLQTLSSVLATHIQEPEQRESRLKYLLDVLSSDGYLVLSDGRFSFRSALLREFWTRRVLP